ncbi:MAG: hypothetical protein AABY10_00220 [Nanoarchaeota archaeon]
MNEEFVWQCSCGNIAHKDIMPEDCPACFSVGEFAKIPEDQLAEKTDEEILRRKKLKQAGTKAVSRKIVKSNSKQAGRRKK